MRQTIVRGQESCPETGLFEELGSHITNLFVSGEERNSF